MKMNKVLGLGLTIVLSLGCLVGCNKTEEEKIKEDVTIIEDVETYELTDKEKELNKTVLNDDMFEITFIKAYEDEYGEIGYEAEMENCLDLLSVADKLIVASDLSKGVCREIDFANLVGMEVEYLENTE